MKNFKQLWLISLLVKLIVSALLPLSADEAYYWVWSQRLQLSYFDHPPMVAWLFSLGQFLEPLGNAVRWPAVILGHMTMAIWYLLLKDRFSTEQIRWWMYLALFSPLLGFGSIIVTPDVPVVFFWSLSLLLFRDALERKSAIHYGALGAALGLGFCAKYHIVLFLPCLALYLLFEKKWREIQWKWVPLTLMFGLLFCTPVLLWNYQNNFASFEFQLKHGLEKSVYSYDWTLSYLLGQIAIIFPLVAWAALRAKTTQRYFLYFAWAPILFFFLTSFRAIVEANWPIIAYPAILALAISYPRIRKWLTYYVAFNAFVIMVVVATLFVPSLRSINEKISEPYAFQELSEETKNFQPLYASSYQMAASLWYFSKTPVFKLKEISRYDFFDTLEEKTPAENFYLAKRINGDLPVWVVEQGYVVTEIKKIGSLFHLLKVDKP